MVDEPVTPAPTAPAAPAAPATPAAPAAPTLGTDAPAAPAADAKPADPAAPFDVTKLTLPEGVAKDDPMLGDFAKLAGDLPEGKAQALIDLYAKQMKAGSDASTTAWNAVQDKWQAELKADPELGGDKTPVVQATISKALEQFGAPGVKEAFNLTGAGNNPAIVKTFFNMAKQLTEGAPKSGSPASAAPRTAAEIMYPELSKG